MYVAHTAPDNGREQSVEDHLRTVAKLAEKFGGPLGFGEEAYLAGLLHDCGKYGDRFQRRLQGKASGVDHWSVGAYVAMQHKSVAACLAIHGHHVGLSELTGSFVKGLSDFALGRMEDPDGRSLSGTFESIIERLSADGIEIPALDHSLIRGKLSKEISVEVMMGVRMLYSCLVDADFLDTEAHFHQTADGEKRFRTPAPEFCASDWLDRVQAHVETLTRSAKMSPSVAKMRWNLWEDSLAAATEPMGLRTMTAPTGSGKTLAMLGYALSHAKKFHKKRIIVALPFLNIIEQTVKEYRDVLGCSDERTDVILEHHSLAERSLKDRNGPSRLASDNWDAPIVITTTVQLFESMFSNRPGRARKLHRLADAVLLLDEIQTLPLPLVIPTVAGLAALSRDYRTTVVLATATQPAFDHLATEISTVTQAEYRPVEIVSSAPPTIRRVEAEFRDQDQDWESLAQELRTEASFLVIVNLKRHALALAKSLAEVSDQPVYHISTNMCAEHRLDVLVRIREALKHKIPCRVVATQCVEAGVDLDFPTVYRAWGPADSLAQAAGRCNRAGLGLGRFVVFQPHDASNAYPSPEYQQATEVTKALWRLGGLDLDSPQTFREYWTQLYSATRPAESHPEILDAMETFRFAEVARKYQLIKGPTMQVLVPYLDRKELYDSLVDTARTEGIAGQWIKQAQRLSVGLYKPKDSAPVFSYLEPVFDRGQVRPSADQESNWWIYTNQKDYSSLYGLVIPIEWGLLLA